MKMTLLGEYRQLKDKILKLSLYFDTDRLWQFHTEHQLLMPGMFMKDPEGAYNFIRYRVNDILFEYHDFEERILNPTHSRLNEIRAIPEPWSEKIKNEHTILCECDERIREFYNISNEVISELLTFLAKVRPKAFSRANNLNVLKKFLSERDAVFKYTLKYIEESKNEKPLVELNHPLNPYPEVFDNDSWQLFNYLVSAYGTNSRTKFSDIYTFMVIKKDIPGRRSRKYLEMIRKEFGEDFVIKKITTPPHGNKDGWKEKAEELEKKRNEFFNSIQ